MHLYMSPMAVPGLPYPFYGLQKGHFWFFLFESHWLQWGSPFGSELFPLFGSSAENRTQGGVSAPWCSGPQAWALCLFHHRLHYEHFLLLPCNHSGSSGGWSPPIFRQVPDYNRWGHLCHRCADCLKKTWSKDWSFLPPKSLWSLRAPGPKPGSTNQWGNGKPSFFQTK